MIRRHASRLGVLLLVAACSFAVAAAAARRATARSQPRADVSRATPGSDTASVRRELVMVYIGSSTCAVSNRRELRADVRQIQRQLQARAAATGRTFVSLGVAVDRRADAGLRHLERMGRFDEVAAGQGWANAHARRYVWEEWPGIAGTPQIVLIEREIRVVRDGPGGVNYASGPERLVLRKAGLWEIGRWREAGAPLPDLR
jgi:hypothetical protein